MLLLVSEFKNILQCDNNVHFLRYFFLRGYLFTLHIYTRYLGPEEEAIRTDHPVCDCSSPACDPLPVPTLCTAWCCGATPLWIFLIRFVGRCVTLFSPLGIALRRRSFKMQTCRPWSTGTLKQSPYLDFVALRHAVTYPLAHLAYTTQEEFICTSRELKAYPYPGSGIRCWISLPNIVYIPDL